MTIKIKRQTIESIPSSLSHLPVLLQRVYSLRGVTNAQTLERELTNLLNYQQLSGIETAASLLAEAIEQQKKIMIIGDFDADGATSTALAVRALRAMGAQQVDFLVPSRFKFGYGLTPGIVDLANQKSPDMIITVDNGIASIDGVKRAKQLGIRVVVTDHHLAADQLPDADAIVNPNQANCQFASKHLAGVGVIFYVLLALRAELRQRQWFADRPEVNLATFLDIVALGTVADVVSLDQNNRILVHQGLQRIQAGKCCVGIKALLAAAKRDIRTVQSADLGFSLGPRLNAAGRLEDMSLGIECLLTDDPLQAKQFAERLDQLNSERKVIENTMREQAFQDLAHLHLDKKSLPAAICLLDDNWHQGVIGILASRVKEKYHRPTIIFAASNQYEIKGSARSIPGLHIRDALDMVAKQQPTLIEKFGGHAMAAGLTIQKTDFAKFCKCFNQCVEQVADQSIFQQQVVSDGDLSTDEMTLQTAQLIQQAGPWGQGFAEPLFDGEFVLLDQRIVGQQHLKCTLGLQQKIIEAIAFNIDLKQWPDHRCQQVHVVYRLAVNHYNGRQSLQLMIQHMEKLAPPR